MVSGLVVGGVDEGGGTTERENSTQKPKDAE
jgi:hypothetical protein